MVYVTVMQSPSYHQMSLEDLLFGSMTMVPVVSRSESNTHTYLFDSLSARMASSVSVKALTKRLAKFNRKYEALHNTENRAELYYSFHIPKRSGGLRRIDAPKDELMEALRELKKIFEVDFRALYHTSAFAYVKGRCTVDAVRRHQANESKWFAKLDLSDFFGSTTPEFVLQMFSMVFPFSEVMKHKRGYEELSKALSLAFLNGGLPQGTPISPTITNIMMIPIDFTIAKSLRDFNKQSFVYTRYADDFIISSKFHFDIHQVEDHIVSTLNNFGAPFSINSKKTRYGSSAGRNWNLGVMLNQDNEITVGYKKKRQLKAMMSSYIEDRRSGVRWSDEDLMTMQGLWSYYRMVEKDTIDKIVEYLNEKFNVDILGDIKADLRPV